LRPTTPPISLLAARPVSAQIKESVTLTIWAIIAGAFILVSFGLSSGLAQNYSPDSSGQLPLAIADQSSHLVFGVFLGVMLTASTYLFFIWIVMRDRGQIFLLCLLLCLTVNLASTNDFLTAEVGIYSSPVRNFLINYSMIMSCIFSIIFTHYFLEIDINSPTLTGPLFLLCIALFLLLIYSIFDQSLVHFILPMLTTLTIVVILIAGLVSLRRKASGSFTHIIAFIFFLLGSLAGPLYNLGYIIDTDTTRNLTYVSYSMSALMFAIVIASQFAARQEEKEKALAVSNERFALATRGANEGLFDWNLENGEVFFSDQLRKIIGLRLENIPESLKLWIHMILPTDRRIVREALRRFRHNPEINTINIEYRILQPNDTRRWLHTKVVATRDPRTRGILRMVGSTSDITTRKQSEVALRASEARFRSITEAHPVPVMIVSLRNQAVLYASPGAEQLLGLTQKDLLYESFNRFLDDNEERKTILGAMNTGQEVNRTEVVLNRSDNGKLQVALSARRISYQNEDAMVIGLYDLTERKQAEAQIARQQDALQQSEKMAALGGLLAGVAHELNNPLSVVVGQATLLMEGSAEPKVVSRAEKIFKAADRCTRIVKSFLALARRKPPERKPVRLNDVIVGALELLGYQLRTGEIDTQLDLDPTLPEITGDDDQLMQVITNMVLNAAQAMDDWKGTRRVIIRSRRDENNHVLVSFADTGPGVPPEIRSRIFEPFFTTKHNKGGTGVGLSLCLNIIASHGGQLLLEDTPGGGATFIVLLPMAESSSETSQLLIQSPHVLPDKLSILIVDDEFEIAQTLADLLEPEGYKTDIAANGSIALQKLHRSSYDIIISDLRMPVMDGPALYESLRRELPSYLNKIVYVTGDTLSSNVQAFLSEYAVPVVEKPYRLNDVLKAMASLLKPDLNNVTIASNQDHATKMLSE
jgi:PAS domain S-box-containing protein